MVQKDISSHFLSFTAKSLYYCRYLPHFLSLCSLAILFGLTPYGNLYISSLFYTYLRGSDYHFFTIVALGLIIQQTFSAVLHGILQMGSSILGAYQSYLIRDYTTALICKRISRVKDIGKLDQKVVADLDTLFSYANKLVFSVICSFCSLVGNFVYLYQFGLMRFSLIFFTVVLSNDALVYLFSASQWSGSLASLTRRSNNQSTSLRKNIRTLEENRSVFSGQSTKLTWLLESFEVDNLQYSQTVTRKVLYRSAIETIQQIFTRLIHPLTALFVISFFSLSFPLSSSSISSYHLVGLGSILQIFKTYSSLWREGSFCKKNMGSLTQASSAFRNFSTAFYPLSGDISSLSHYSQTNRLPSLFQALLRSLFIFTVVQKTLVVVFGFLDSLGVFLPAHTFINIPSLSIAFLGLTLILLPCGLPRNHKLYATLFSSLKKTLSDTNLFSRLDIDLAANLFALVTMVLSRLLCPGSSLLLSQAIAVSVLLACSLMLTQLDRRLNLLISQSTHNANRQVITSFPLPSKTVKSATHRALALIKLGHGGKNTHDNMDILVSRYQSSAQSSALPPTKIICRQRDLGDGLSTIATPSLTFADGKPYPTQLTALQSFFYSYLITNPASLTPLDQRLLTQWPLAEQFILSYLENHSIGFDILQTGQVDTIKKGIISPYLSGGQKFKLSCAILFAVIKLANAHLPAGVFLGIDEGEALEGFNPSDQAAVYRPICLAISEKPNNYFSFTTNKVGQHALDTLFNQPSPASHANGKPKT